MVCPLFLQDKDISIEYLLGVAEDEGRAGRAGDMTKRGEERMYGGLCQLEERKGNARSKGGKRESAERGHGDHLDGDDGHGVCYEQTLTSVVIRTMSSAGQPSEEYASLRGSRRGRDQSEFIGGAKQHRMWTGLSK